MSQVEEKAARFRQHLQHPAIRDVRNVGLLMAVELDDFDKVQRVIKYCLEQGLITDWFLFNDRSLRIAPPLIINNSHKLTGLVKLSWKALIYLKIKGALTLH